MTRSLYLINQKGVIQQNSASSSAKTIQEVAPEIDWASLLERAEHRIFPEITTCKGTQRLEIFPMESGSPEGTSLFGCLFCSQTEQQIGQLQDQLENMQRIIDAMPFGVAIIRRDKYVYTMNRAALDLAGYENLEEFLALGKPCQETFCPAPIGGCPVWDKGNLFDKTERPFLLRDGTKIKVLKSAVPVEIEGEIMMLEGIIDLRKQKELEEMASTDPLTGALNRKGMEEKLQTFYEAALEGTSPLTVMMIDLDNFKLINDSYGHFVGDKVLQAIARIIGDLLGETELLARWGGDEFLIGTQRPEKGTLELGRAILDNVRKTHFFEDSDRKEIISLSIGMTSYSPGMPLRDILKEADTLMYGAKRRKCGIFSSSHGIAAP